MFYHVYLRSWLFSNLRLAMFCLFERVEFMLYRLNYLKWDSWNVFSWLAFQEGWVVKGVVSSFFKAWNNFWLQFLCRLNEGQICRLSCHSVIDFHCRCDDLDNFVGQVTSSLPLQLAIVLQPGNFFPVIIFVVRNLLDSSAGPLCCQYVYHNMHILSIAAF